MSSKQSGLSFFSISREARRLELEHAGGVARRHHLVDAGVVERQRVDVASRTRCPPPRPATARASATSHDAFCANNEDGTFDPATDALHDHRDRAELPARRADLPRRRRQRVGRVQLTSGSTRGTRRSTTGSGRSTPRTPSTGPFTASKSAPTILEIATTYDPATPFRGAKRLATQLGNVRFLTMVGDGHTAYQRRLARLHRHGRRRADRDADAPAQGHHLPAGPPVRARRRQRRRYAPRPAAARHGSARAAPPAAAHAPLARTTVRAGRSHQAPSAYACAHTRAAAAIRLGPAPAALVWRVPGLRQAALSQGGATSGSKARPRSATRSAATRRNGARLDGREVAVPGVAREIEIAAPEAERVGSARAVGHAGVGRPVVGGLLPPGRRRR